MTGPVVQPPQPAPTGLSVKFHAMTLAEIEHFLDTIRGYVQTIRDNVPPGRQTDVNAVLGVLQLAETISDEKHKAAQPLPVTASIGLDQALSMIQQIEQQQGSVS